MRKVSTFCWEKMKTIRIIIDSIWSIFFLPKQGGAQLLDTESHEPNCLFRYKLIIRKSFSLKMKFKLCDSTDPPGIWFHYTTVSVFAITLHVLALLLDGAFTSLMKSPMSPGWGAADLMGYCGSGWRGLSSRRRIPTGLMASGSIVSGCCSWLRS